METKNDYSKKFEESKIVDCTDVRTDIMMQEVYEDLMDNK